MYLKEYLSWMVHTYPLMFKSDTLEETQLKSLDHLFFITGNGMEWYDGYLLELESTGVEWKKKETKHSFRVITKGPRYTEICYTEPLDEAFLKMDTVEEVMAGPMKITIPQRNKHPWFPAELDEYSRIMDIPKKVRPDWLAGASKYLTAAIAFYADPVRVAKDDENFIAVTDLLRKKDASVPLDTIAGHAKRYIEAVETNLRKAVAVILPRLKKAGIAQGTEDDIINGIRP